MSLRPNTFNGHVEGAKSGLPIEHQVDVNGLQVHAATVSQSVSSRSPALTPPSQRTAPLPSVNTSTEYSLARATSALPRHSRVRRVLAFTSLYLISYISPYSTEPSRRVGIVEVSITVLGCACGHSFNIQHHIEVAIRFVHRGYLSGLRLITFPCTSMANGIVLVSSRPCPLHM